jgi:thioredoxin-related protein
MILKKRLLSLLILILVFFSATGCENLDNINLFTNLLENGSSFLGIISSENCSVCRNIKYRLEQLDDENFLENNKLVKSRLEEIKNNFEPLGVHSLSEIIRIFNEPFYYGKKTD